MAFLTKAEFAELCGQTSGNLTNYINRGKVVMSDDFIDDTLPINQLYLAHRRELMEKKAAQSPDPVAADQPADIPASKPGPAPKKIPAQHVTSKSISGAKAAANAKPNTEVASSVRRKNDATAEKALIDAKLAALKYEKEMGKLMSIDLVQLIIGQLGQSFVNSYRSMSESFLTEIAHKARLSADDHAVLKGKLVKGINDAHELAIKKSKNEMAQVIKNAVIIPENEE